ncbi:MAG: helix-turn-helix domain-containing protein [Clostridiales Family XIII bacterium]|jgi:hypothetical protein|nr:helix-turn-helix domain-containing protein [Clostridiales Family XIII bacterium]
MKISADLIHDALEGRYAISSFGHIGGELSLEKVLFARGQDVFRDGQIYLVEDASAISLPPKRAASVALVVGDAGRLPERFETVFAFDGGVSVFELHNAVQEVYARCAKWDECLQDLLNKGSDVQAMIDASTPVLGNPLILHDGNFTSIAVSDVYRDEPALLPVLDNKRLPYLMKSDKSGRNRSRGRGDVVPLSINDRHALYVNLSQQGKFKYRLIVIEFSRELTEGDAALLEHLSLFIQLAIGLVLNESTEEAVLSRIMTGILSGEYSDSRYIEQQLNGLGWQREHTFICAKVFADILDFRNRTLHFICDSIRSAFAEQCVFEYDNCIVGVFNLAFYDGDADRIETALLGFLQDNNLKAGVSNVFSGFENFKQYYQQASAALDVGPRRKPYTAMHRFRDVVEAFLLESCMTRLPAQMLCAPELLKLKAHDAKHRTDLYRTLYVFLKNNLRSVNTAKELFIHRSTFLYRLDRIREITGLCLDDNVDMWYLLFSFKLLEYAGQ